MKRLINWWKNRKWTFGDNRPGMSFECVKIEFAQELEKELAEAKRLLATRVEASRLDDAERRFQYQKEENDNRIKQIRKLQQELHDLNTKDNARTREYNILVQENRELYKQLADSPKMLGMATDLNMMLQNKADMWRDEFQRIKALCHGKPLEWLEVAGICDRAMSDIRRRRLETNQPTSTMLHSPKPETNEVQTAEAVAPAANCSAWWMYDNHTFQKVDVTEPNWRGYVMTCYDIDGFGSFFVRESPNGKTIFNLHGRGKEGREAFAAALNAWTPPNAATLARAMDTACGASESNSPRASVKPPANVSGSRCSTISWANAESIHPESKP